MMKIFFNHMFWHSFVFIKKPSVFPFIKEFYKYVAAGQNGTLDIIYNGRPQPTIQLISLDIESGIAIAENISFLPQESQGIKIGNVFYNQGLIVITRDVAEKLQNQWQLDYKSTKTIYENEYLLIVNEDEFNVSQNPTAVVEVGKKTEIKAVGASEGTSN